MVRGSFLLCLVATFAALLHQTYSTPPFQGATNFGLECTGCKVAGGMGYKTFGDDCSCFYICQMLDPSVLKSGAGDWLSFKRCCPCGMTWSQKTLTCVDWRSKLSACFPSTPGGNPCNGQTSGAKLPRENPNSVEGSLCAGFIECLPISMGSSDLMPVTKCCPSDDCFNDGSEMCTEACESEVCEALGDNTDDCECDVATEGPVAIDCHFTAVAGDVNKFMGKQSMYPYDCAPGTCWDQDLCACVLTNQTGYAVGCRKYMELEIAESELTVEDGGEFTIYNSAEDVTFSSSEAIFDGATGTYLSIGGTASGWLGNTWVFNIEFLIEDIGEEDESQCLFGDCLRFSNAAGSDQKISVVVDRNADGTADGVTLTMNYQDQPLLMTGNLVNEEEVALDLEVEFAIDTDYEYWCIYQGDLEQAGCALYEQGNETPIDTVEAELESTSYNLLLGSSGFVFGTCLSNQGFEGRIDFVDMWTCIDDTETIEAVYDDIFEV